MTDGERREGGSTLTLTSGGSRVEVEWFPVASASASASSSATSSSKGPAVLMLHGADGLRLKALRPWMQAQMQQASHRMLHRAGQADA